MKPNCVYVGYEVFDDVEIEDLPPVEKKIHELPPGLKQRFVPIGNRHTRSSIEVLPELKSKVLASESNDASSPSKFSLFIP